MQVRAHDRFSSTTSLSESEISTYLGRPRRDVARPRIDDSSSVADQGGRYPSRRTGSCPYSSKYSYPCANGRPMNASNAG